MATRETKETESLVLFSPTMSLCLSVFYCSYLPPEKRNFFKLLRNVSSGVEGLTDCPGRGFKRCTGPDKKVARQ